MTTHKAAAPVWTRDGVLGAREAATLAGTLGREVQIARRRRRLTQAKLARRVGISAARLSQIERGQGKNAPLSLWVKLGIAIRRPLAVGFSRDVDPLAEPRDAGHLEVQEVVLTLARSHGLRANVELATRPADPVRFADVVLRDDRLRVLLLIEIVNRAGDLGATLRSMDRKAVELERFAILAGGDAGAYRIYGGWLLVDSVANHALVRRYPEFLSTRFPGPSSIWARALTDGAPPPSAGPAVAWIDPRSGRIRPLRWRRD